MWLGYDTISLYGFGISSGLLGNPEVRYITDVVKMHTIKLAVYEQWPLLDRLGVGWIVAAVLLICSKPVRDFNKWHAKFMNTAIANNRPEARGIFTPVIQQSQDLNPHGSHTQLQAMTEGSLNVLTSEHLQAKRIRFSHSRDRYDSRCRNPRWSHDRSSILLGALSTGSCSTTK